MFSATRMPVFHLLAIYAFASSLWTNRAIAEPPPASRVVRYHDLDLSTEAGTQKLYERIKAAADLVCFQDTRQTRADQQALYVACYEDAVARAVSRISQPRLASLHRAQSRPGDN